MREKMLLRQVGRFCLRPSPVTSVICSRWSSSDKNYVRVEQDSEMENVAIVTMQKKPVNSLCKDHLDQLHTTFEDLSNSKKYKAAILTSNIPKIFCAGLDILSIRGTTTDEVYQFWKSFQRAWISIYGTRLITVAAVNGNSPAGGCVLALSCDHSVMAEGKYRIGLNGSQVGLAAPYWVLNCMVNAIGFNEASKALQEGRMFTTSEAHRIGLINEVKPPDEILPTCRNFINNYFQVNYEARALTKQTLRAKILDELKNSQHESADYMANYLTSDGVQAAIGQYLEGLSSRKK